MGLCLRALSTCVIVGVDMKVDLTRAQMLALLDAGMEIEAGPMDSWVAGSARALHNALDRLSQTLYQKTLKELMGHQAHDPGKY